MLEPKFKSGDYIINRNAGDMAIINKIDKYLNYTFKEYYGAMFDELRDTKNKMCILHAHYQKFWDFCTDEEKAQLEAHIKRLKAQP